MATTPEQHFIQAYRSDFEMLYQQQKSRLFNAVRVEPQDAESDYFQHIGILDDDDELDTVRHADTKWDEVPHLRRRVNLQAKTKAVPLDKTDAKMMGSYDPTNGYVQALTGYFGRFVDRQILAGLGGVALTGKDGSTSVNNYDDGECRLMAGDGSWVTAGSDHSNTTATNLTVTKLNALGEMLSDANVPEDNRFLVLNEKNVRILLTDTTWTAAEVMTIRDIASGKVGQVLGFNLIVLPTAQFTVNSAETDCIECYAWHRDAMLLSTGSGGYVPEIRIDERSDKNYTKQIWNKIYAGKTRLQGPGVIEVLLKYN